MSRGARKILAMLLWSMIVPETPARAQPDASEIWGEVIMAQPFDTVPGRQDSRVGQRDHRVRLRAFGSR